MKVEFTVGAFPSSGTNTPRTASIPFLDELKKECGLPFGVAISPLAETPTVISEEKEETVHTITDNIARCSNCGGYINSHSEITGTHWICNLCKSRNKLTLELQIKYADVGSNRPLELLSETVDVPWTMPPDDDDDLEDLQASNFPEGFPVYIALLDTLCTEDWLECMKSSLITGLEALPSEALFGLITFDDKIKVYDLKTQTPFCRSVTILDDVPLITPLEDICPFEQFLAPIVNQEANKSKMQTTLNAPELPEVQRSEEDPPCRGQGLGTILQALLQYLTPLQRTREASEPGKPVPRCAQILTFLSGPPTLGLGSLDGYITTKKILLNKEKSSMTEEAQLTGSVFSENEKELQQAAKPGLEFYNQTALIAASLGVLIDVFVFTGQSAGLEILSALADHTGGSLWIYTNTINAMLTQDLFRRLTTVNAHSCLLRVRTSSGLKISRVYGRVLRDPRFDEIFHMLSCDPYQTVCMDFEHTSSSGLNPETPLTIQVAFQYSIPVFLPQEDSTKDFEICRRLRISTIKVPVTSRMSKVHNNFKIEATCALLFHKVLIASQTEDYLKAALLLQDWLVILAASVTKNSGTLFESRELFLPLIRFVYGLLRSPVLLGKYFSSNNDTEVFLKLLWSSLSPGDLYLAVYPNLISFWSDSSKGMEHHSLSHASMESTKAPIYIMDSFDTIAMYYSKYCPVEFTYPPPPGSIIRKTVNDLRQNRKLAPKYITLREGDLVSSGFVHQLIDEPLMKLCSLEGESGVVFTGFMNFMEWVKSASEHYLMELKSTS
eukprot:g1452.t1